jgi:hypothetical protein
LLIGSKILNLRLYCTIIALSLIWGVKVGAINMVWKVNTKIAQSQFNADRKSPSEAS